MIMLQKFKSVVVNAFMLWFFSAQKLLEHANTFEEVKSCRTKINSISFLCSFLIYLCPDLLRRAEQLAAQFSGVQDHDATDDISEDLADIENSEESRMRTIAFNTNRF